MPDVGWVANGTNGDGGAVPVLSRRSRRALELLDGCYLAGLIQHVHRPTRGANFLDLTLSNSQDVLTVVRDGVFPSDHREVVCELRTVRVPAPVVSRSSALNYKRADWAGLRQALRLIPWGVLDGLPIDAATELFYDLLSAAVRDFIPLVQLKRRRPPWFERELRAALKEKEAAHRRMKAAGTPDSRELFREKRRIFKSMANDRYVKYLNELVDDLNTNPKRFWSFLKCIKGKNGHMSHLIDGNRRVEDDREKAELLNRSFASKFSDPAINEFPSAREYDLDTLRSFYVTDDTVRSVLCSIDPHKACGPDNVSGRVIRECASELSVPITRLCRMSLEQGVFPRQWKCANIVPIHKKGSKTSPNNYRSVSLLPLFGKVLERIVFDQLFSHVRPAISARQHGFFPGRSCATNLCTMLHTAWTNISAGSQTDVIYTDFSSAFQSVNHRLLLHKLNISYQISDKALDWIDSYLTGREQRVVVGGKSSEWVPVGSGTPEGGLLSPLLFACFVNDLPETLDVDTLLFADDV